MQGERHWVKFHFKTQQGHKHWTNARQPAVVGQDRESRSGGSVRRDRSAETFRVGRSKFRSCRRRTSEKTLVQPFDLTKVWPHGDYPADRRRHVELNRNPDNYFAESSRPPFRPRTSCLASAFRPDKMLQARIFSYADAHRYRLGTHYEALPVNAPRCPVHQLSQGRRDAVLRQRDEPGRLLRAQLVQRPGQDRRFAEPPLKIYGDADRYDHRDGNDDYRQPGDLFRLIGREAQQRLIDNTVEAMQGVPVEIIKRWIAHCYKADPKYGKGLAVRMDLSASDLPSAAAAE